MDFVDWCDRALTTMAQVMSTSPQARTMGMQDLELAVALFGKDAVYGPTRFINSERHHAVREALLELHRAGVVEQPSQSWWRLGELGEAAAADHVGLWAALAKPELTPQRQELLEIVNRLKDFCEIAGVKFDS